MYMTWIVILWVLKGTTGSHKKFEKDMQEMRKQTPSTDQSRQQWRQLQWIKPNQLNQTEQQQV
jgi:hypothetical protein